MTTPQPWRDKLAAADKRLAAAERERTAGADDRALAYYEGLHAEFGGKQADMARALNLTEKTISGYISRARKVRAAMPWNHMQIELVPEDMLARPLIGPGGLTREQAHAEVQSLLDRAPALATVAATWRRGAADDTVYAGPFTWTIYPYPAGDDPRRAALEWLEDFVRIMRDAGMPNVSVAKMPDA